MNDVQILKSWLLCAVGGAALGALVSIAQSCATKPAPVGIVYPPKREVNPAAASALVVIVQDEASGRWIWLATAKNNQAVAASEQDFATPDAARENYELTRQILEAHPAPTISNLKL